MKRQTVQFLHSEALPNQGWSNPNSSQRDVESGEKSHCGVECFSGDEQLQEQPMNSWVSQIPRLGFTHSCLPWVSRILQSCFSRQTTPSEKPQGRHRIPSSEVSAPAAPLDTCPVLSTAAKVDFSLELIAQTLQQFLRTQEVGKRIFWNEVFLQQNVILKLSYFLYLKTQKNLIQLLMDFKLRGKSSFCRKAHLSGSAFTIQPLFCYRTHLVPYKMVQSFSLVGKGLKGIFKPQKFEFSQ